MKTQIKTIIATTFAALVLTAGSVSANANITHPAKATTVTSKQLKTFKRVAVSGNVEVTFLQSNKEGIAYADNSNGDAKVMQNGDLLTISAADNGAAKLIVYVKNIYRIQGSDNAVIKTEGKLTSDYLQIFLKGNAKADVNTMSGGLYTILYDNSVLTLSGATENHTLSTDKNSNLSMSHFAAKNTYLEAQPTLANAEKLALTK